MIKVDVSSVANQQIVVPFKDGTATISMYYSALNSCWFCSISYGDNTVNNIVIDYGVNFAYPFRYMFPFGLVCYTESEVRPVYVDSFESGEATLILLEGEENLPL
ncbi:MAG: hypothetical protein J5656_06715 [Clostridia bacterium]|nr:hypothetical protein [Clostridia bacterium]